MEKWKFLPLPGFEPRPLSRLAHSQSLYRLRYPGSHISQYYSLKRWIEAPWRKEDQKKQHDISKSMPLFFKCSHHVNGKKTLNWLLTQQRSLKIQFIPHKKHSLHYDERVVNTVFLKNIFNLFWESYKTHTLWDFKEFYSVFRTSTWILRKSITILSCFCGFSHWKMPRIPSISHNISSQ
jgi:hypothetical protein